MDAIKLLIDDHKTVEDLFLTFEDTSDEEAEDKAALAASICKALTIHTMIEEELFYPEARKVEGMNAMLDEALEEHAEAKKTIMKIKTMATGFALDLEMGKLKGAIEHHVEEEETEMFPKLQKQGMETAQLGALMMERKLQLQKMF